MKQSENGIAEGFNEDVPVSLIFMDPDYGRPPLLSHINFLASNWDQAKSNIILLSLRDDGTFACLDGWHRVLACREANGGDSTLRAFVLIDLTVAQEAEYFVSYNRDRRSLRPYELFRARLAQGEVRARAILATVHGVDLELGAHRTKGHVRAIRAVERVYEMGAAPLLTWTLGVLRAAWESSPACDPYTTPAIEGLARFRLRYPGVDRRRVMDILRKLGPLGMASEMIKMKSVMTSPSSVAWGKALREKYNTKTRSGRLPEWQENVHSEGGKQSRRKKMAAAKA